MNIQFLKNRAEFLIVVLGLFSLSTLIILLETFKKYGIVTIVSLSEMCKQMIEGYTLKIDAPISAGLAVLLVSGLIGSFVKIFTTIKKTNTKVSILEQKQSLPQKKLENLLKELNLIDKLSVIKENKHSAFVIGILRPKIYISTKLVSDLSIKELEAVLLHEKHHLKEKHPAKLLLLSAVQSSLFFFPIVKDIVAHIKISMEYEADRFVISQQGTKTHLLNTLNKFRVDKTNRLALSFAALSKSQRMSDKHPNFSFNMKTLLVSIAMVAIGAVLLEMPANAQNRYIVETNDCTQNELQIPTDNQSRNPIPMSAEN